MLPHDDDDYRALTSGEDERSENKHAPDDENGNKITKIQRQLTRQRRDNNDLRILGNESNRRKAWTWQAAQAQIIIEYVKQKTTQTM